MQSSGSTPRGILRLVDSSGIIEAAEAVPFVDSGMGRTVPGNSGPVTLAIDSDENLRTTPGGKLIACASGGFLEGTVDPVTGDR